MNTIFTSLHMLGKISVDVFVLISGYFLLKDKFEFKFKKIILIISQVFLYSILWVGIDLILWGFGYIEISDIDFFNTLFPYFNLGWWFVVIYLVLLLLSPFINVLINNITKKQHIGLIIGLSISLFILSGFASSVWYNQIGLFICLYLVGAFIKKYGIIKQLSARNCLVLFIITLILAISTIPISIMFGGSPALLIEQNSFFVF